MKDIKTQILGEIDTDIKQHTCPVNQETVFGISSCAECDGYQMCIVDKESDIFLFRIN